jgi:hypothetical protein
MTLALQTVDRRRAFPPRMSEFTRRFWQGLAASRFETTRCDDCARLTFPPKPFCPHCWSQRVTWVPLSGRRQTLFADGGPRGAGRVSGRIALSGRHRRSHRGRANRDPGAGRYRAEAGHRGGDRGPQLSGWTAIRGASALVSQS